MAFVDLSAACTKSFDPAPPVDAAEDNGERMGDMGDNIGIDFASIETTGYASVPRTDGKYTFFGTTPDTQVSYTAETLNHQSSILLLITGVSNTFLN